ncbi:hypothetical protein M405DRAFT_868859, partial [Rhizopogon salebrosus TDB-379]
MASKRCTAVTVFEIEIFGATLLKPRQTSEEMVFSEDRCLVPLKGHASTSSDSKTVSTTAIRPSPFLGAPFTFALSPYVPATPAVAAVHTPSPAVESAPTPADALATPAGTVAYTPTITLSSTAEPVPGLLPFRELRESAKGGQTCGSHRQLNDAASRTSARPGRPPLYGSSTKSKDMRAGSKSALLRCSKTNKSDLKDYGFTLCRSVLWSWDSNSVLKSGFTTDKALPPCTAGTLLSIDDHRKPSSSATVDQGQLLPLEMSRCLQNQNDPSQIDPARCSPPPPQMCASSSCAMGSRTSTPMDQNLPPQTSGSLQRSSPPGPTGSTPMDQDSPPRLRSQNDKQCRHSPTPLMSMSACAPGSTAMDKDPPSQIN